MNTYLFKFLFIILIFSTFQNKSLIFPFITLPYEGENIENTLSIEYIENFIKKSFRNYVYIQLELGSPTQKIYLNIDMDSNDFFLSKLNANFEKEYPKKNGNFYFNQNLSKTFSFQSDKINKKYYSYFQISEYATDNFLFYTTDKIKNIIKIENFDFLLAKEVKGPNHGIIGLKEEKKDDERYYFLKALKKYKLINDSIWYLDYKNKYNGSFIVGNYPHEDENLKAYNNELYNEKNFINIYAFISKNNWDSEWGLKFNKIFIKHRDNSLYNEEEISVNCKKCKIALIDLSINMIIGSKNYKYIFENSFIHKYINKKICFKQHIRLNYKSYNFFYYYYCNSSYFNEIKKNFEPIIFQHMLFQVNFTLDFEDLYINNDNYFVLTILFEEYNNKNWFLGAPFLRKYSFYFNSETKEIGFYKPPINKKNKINFNLKILYDIFIILSILISIFFIFKIISFAKNLFKSKRKLRADELEMIDYKSVDLENKYSKINSL